MALVNWDGEQIMDVYVNPMTANANVTNWKAFANQKDMLWNARQNFDDVQERLFNKNFCVRQLNLFSMVKL